MGKKLISQNVLLLAAIAVNRFSSFTLDIDCMIKENKGHVSVNNLCVLS